MVCNVGVLTEGWDCPPVKCCILARPTKSLALYMQMAGRTLRPWHDTTPIILDHGGNVDRHGMPHEDRDWSLTTKPKRTGAVANRLCKTCYAYIAVGCGTCPHCGAGSIAGEVRAKAEDVIDVALSRREAERIAVEGRKLTRLRDKKAKADALEAEKVRVREAIRAAPIPTWALNAHGEPKELAMLHRLLKAQKVKGHKPGWVLRTFRFALGYDMPARWQSYILDSGHRPWA